MPMLKLENVYKRFGSQLAVNDLSFELNAGEIVGLLGPNGAGKTTTMRLIASYFFPDVGKIYVAGHNTVTRTLLTQADIGYLPENNPLYPDMLVVDFLLLTWGLSDGQQKQRLNHSAQLQRIHCVEIFTLLGCYAENIAGYGRFETTYRCHLLDSRCLLGLP